MTAAHTVDPLWQTVDGYFETALVRGDAPFDQVLDACQSAAKAAGLPAISVSPALGKALALLVGAAGAKRVLEVGTLAGYSTLWMARAVGPGGRVVTLELEPHHAEVATRNIARAGLADRVQVRVGPALQSLEAMHGEGLEPFDLAFIDADKPNNLPYLTHALRLVRPGALIVVDNAVRRGAVADAASKDASVLGVRALVDYLRAHPRLQSTALQMVGVKGYDGIILILAP